MLKPTNGSVDANPKGMLESTTVAKKQMKLYGKTLGTKLKELREYKGWAQREILERIDYALTQPNYVMYENDKIKKPNRAIIEKIAAVYGVDADELLRKHDPFEHLPVKVRAMLEDIEAAPFLIEAYEKYAVHVTKKAQI